MSGIVPPVGGPADAVGAASMLGPASSVMQSIFDSVEDPDAEAPSEEVDAAGEAHGQAAPTAADLAGAADGDAGDAGEGGTAGEATAATGASEPAGPPAVGDDKAIVEQIGGLTEALDSRFTAHYQQQVVEQFQDDYSHYTDLLGMHPLELVGRELPPLDDSDSNVVLSSAQEVKDYQEAVRTILGRMMNSEVERLREEDSEVIEVVHDSIELFQNNPDLIPGAKGFNKPLADHVMRLVAPYALRMDGKLTGFSIDIQGIVDQARGQLKAQVPAAPAAKKAPAKKPGPKPQGGLASKAGSSSAGEEDFTPMWNALGLPSMPV